MKKPALSIYPDSDNLAQAFAEYFSIKAAESINARGRFLVVLSGGGTPQKAYRLLAQEPLKSQVDWPKVHLLWGDERHVSHDDSGSNFFQAREAFLKHIDIPKENLHPMPTHLPPAEAVEAYSQTIISFAEVGQTHIRFDLVLLGLGSDGHTASLFVGQSSLWTNPVISTQGDYEGRPSIRLTMTPELFNHAREIIFLVSGASKAQALADAFGDYHDIDRFPSRAILAETTRWMVDIDAAKTL